MFRAVGDPDRVVTEEDVHGCDGCDGEGEVEDPILVGMLPCPLCEGSGWLIGYRRNGDAYTPVPAERIEK